MFVQGSLPYKFHDDLGMNCDGIESLSIDIFSDHSENIFLKVVYRVLDSDLSISETLV